MSWKCAHEGLHLQVHFPHLWVVFPIDLQLVSDKGKHQQEIWEWEERLGYLFLLKSQLCFFLPRSGVPVSSVALVSITQPLVQCRCGVQIRPRVLKLPHYCLSLRASLSLDFELLSHLWEFMGLVPNTEPDINQMLKIILNGSDSTERNTWENTLLPFQEQISQHYHLSK